MIKRWLIILFLLLCVQLPAEAVSLTPDGVIFRLDQPYQGLITARQGGISGTIWYGTLAGVDFSSFVLTVAPDQTILQGIVTLPGRRYQIHGTQLTSIPLLEATIPLIPMTIPPSTLPHWDDPSRIDLLVLYTPAARAILGGTRRSTIAAIESTIANTNLSFYHSGVPTRLNLVHTRETFYLEQANGVITADLDHFMGKNDGFMDEAHSLRDQHQADLVMLIAGTWFSTYPGIAPIPTPLHESKGFSIVEARFLSTVTFAEQVGYLLGLTADPANATTPPMYPTGYGYQDPTGAFVTIMGKRTGGVCPPQLNENLCPMIERWSNPALSVNGRPTGDVTSNSALAIQEALITVANYRSAFTGVDLLLNGGFEIDADNDRVPDFWSASAMTPTDGVHCDLTARTGRCALTIGAVTLSQRVTFGTADQDDQITLTGYAQGQNVAAGASLQLLAIYANGTRARITLPIAIGTTPYQKLEGTLTLIGPVSALIVRVIGAGGQVTLDDLSVKVEAR
ncbi:MAG: hypothetical protein MUF87_02110 [Anaerolineae bacterium]|nr:hypothetical protein [Anaerolineae bacterium]